jgi:hypothetical protein
VAKGKKTGGKDFIKGNPLSPQGGRATKLTQEQKEISKQLKKYSAKFLIGKFFMMEYSELTSFIQNKKTSQVGELLTARVIEKAVAKADLHVLEWMYARLFGEAKAEVDLNLNMKDLHKIVMGRIKNYQDE